MSRGKSLCDLGASSASSLTFQLQHSSFPNEQPLRSVAHLVKDKRLKSTSRFTFGGVFVYIGGIIVVVLNRKFGGYLAIDRKTLVERAQEFFFEGMLRGWVNGGIEPRFVDGKSGFKAYGHGSSNLRLLDEFCSNGVFSSGQTTIWHYTDPIWTMQYGGWHNREVLDFLMKVLGKQYEARIFTGGRGPESVLSESNSYINTIREKGFGEFWGYEQVFVRGGKYSRCLGRY